jgi:hypothetical protein
MAGADGGPNRPGSAWLRWITTIWSPTDELFRKEESEFIMITQDIVRKLWDEAGNGNIAIWDDDTMTVVPRDYSGETGGKKPLVILKPIALVSEFEFLDFALKNEELLSKIENSIRAAGGTVTRA